MGGAQIEFFFWEVFWGGVAQIGYILLGFLFGGLHRRGSVYYAVSNTLKGNPHMLCSGWQKLRERASGARRKVWTRTKILSPNIRYFVAILRFVAIYAFYKAFIEL